MMRYRLDLSLIPSQLRKRARERLRSEDDPFFYNFADSQLSMLIFLLNKEYFQERGLYEKALLRAWTNQKTTHIIWGGLDIYWGQHMRQDYLPQCDRAKLLAAGDPLPNENPFTVYRGVSKGGEPRGVSWTLDPEIARNFAGTSGAVYKTTILKNDAYAYTGEVSGRIGEKEILLVLPPDHPIEAA